MATQRKGLARSIYTARAGVCAGMAIQQTLFPPEPTTLACPRATVDSSQALPRSFKLGDWEVRLVRIDKNGFGWFIAQDILRILELKGRASLRVLNADEKGLSTVITPGGPQKMTIVRETALYQLVCVSRKPTAKVFRQWLYNKVLPSVRQTGHYANETAPDPVIGESLEIQRQMLTIQRELLEVQKEILAVQREMLELKRAELGSGLRLVNSRH